MDTAMRDLDQLREADTDEGSFRRITVVTLAALSTVALVFAMGVWIGDADGEEPANDDPLAALDRAAGLAPTAAAEPTEPPPTVDRERLTFPSTLAEVETDPRGATPAAGVERPEVAAALPAAEAELEHPDPIVGDGNGLPRREEARADAAGDLAHGHLTALPAAVAAAPSTGPVLARSVQRDPLVADALPAARRHKRAPEGRAGRYTLQVISYRSPDEADLFAEALRARGHEAFVVTADIPNRGRHWRVRIGPFDTLREAESYRAEFEETERMNTYVAKRDDEAS